MLEGEIAYRDGRATAAFSSLRQAVQRATDLPYDEPPGWMVPATHALGALLVEEASSRAVGCSEAHAMLVEAEAVLRADLELHPDNVWATAGLVACLEAAARHSGVDVGGGGSGGGGGGCCHGGGTAAPPLPPTQAEDRACSTDSLARLRTSLERHLSSPHLRASPDLVKALRSGHACLCAGLRQKT
jgi:hypothetical protein